VGARLAAARSCASICRWCFAILRPNSFIAPLLGSVCGAPGLFRFGCWRESASSRLALRRRGRRWTERLDRRRDGGGSRAAVQAGLWPTNRGFSGAFASFKGRR
jgi:hypothetical protein